MMTVVLCYLNNICSIIVADNRISYGKNQEWGYKDNNNKLIDLRNMGWASGTGFADYLDEIQSSLSKLKAKSTDDTKLVYRNVIEKCKKQQPLYSDDIDESVLIASWVGTSNPDFSDAYLRIGFLCNKYYGDEFQFLQKGYTIIFYPGDYDDTAKRKYIDDNFNFEPQQDMNFALKNMLSIFKVISSNSSQVSETCDIGMQVIKGNGIYKLRRGGHINQLIKEFDADNVESKMRFVSMFEV